ncbi:MAG: enoyl-CoA hydratase [Myxococcota bacterium]
MSEPVLLVDKRDQIATVTLNRPAAMNALSKALRAELARVFAELPEDPEVGVILLTGAGDRAFCAGLDLKELSGEGIEGDDAGGAVSSGYDAVQRIEACPLPVIGAINGFAITGGFELALACDLLVASTRARFADTHARVGIMPGWGLSQKLSRLVGLPRAKELSLTGNFLEAEQAADWGLVNRVVEPDALLPTCRALAADMLSCDARLVRAYKNVIDRGFAATYAEGRAIETEANRANSGNVSAESIALRRRSVQERGRAQSTGS